MDLFPGQQLDEKIFLVVREHWIFLLAKFLIIILLVIILVAAWTYGPQFFPQLFINRAGQIVALISELYVLALVVASFLVWVLWYLNIQVITNIRIVDIDQSGIFSRRISELHIDKMEDCTSEQHGFFASIFGFGSVYIQTAAEVERFEFDNIPAPDRIEKLILDLYEHRPNAAQTPPQQPTQA